MRRFVLAAMAAGTAMARADGQAKGGAKLYVTNQGGASITVIDQEKLVVDTLLDLTTMGFSANAKPHHVAVEKDGSYWYVSLIGDGKVVKFDRANRIVGQVAMETPGLLYIDPVHDTLYAGRSMTAPAPPKSLGVIQRSTFRLVDEQEIQITRPHALATSRDGKWTHAASLGEGRIASVETASARVTLTPFPGENPSLTQFTISPDGKTMVAGGAVTNTVYFFDLTRPPPFTPTGHVAIPGNPWDPVFSPDGKSVWFTLNRANALVEIDVKDHTVRRTVTADFAQPYDLIMRADGKYLFVVNQNTGATTPAGGNPHDHMPGMAGMPAMSSKDGWLTVIDVKSGKAVKTLMLGNGPTGMGAAGAR